MSRREIISASITLAVAALLVLILLLVHLTFDPSVLPDPPRPTAGLLEEPEEEYATLYTPPQNTTDSDPLPAHNPEPQINHTEAPDASGQDVRDAGRNPAPDPVRTSSRQSEVKAPERPATPPGPSKEELEQEEARRAARREMADAFSAQSQKQSGNTAAQGLKDGPTGTPSGNASEKHGTGTGSVGGGWIMPRYEAVRSEQTGSVILRAIVNRAGEVVKVEQIGGKAPAAANARLVEACKAEVRARRFTRNNDNAPERAIATITYTWR